MQVVSILVILLEVISFEMEHALLEIKKVSFRLRTNIRMLILGLFWWLTWPESFKNISIWSFITENVITITYRPLKWKENIKLVDKDATK